MLTKPLYATLSNLIVLVEEVVTRPQWARSNHTAFRLRLNDIASEVRAADSRPAEEERVTQAAMAMVIGLEQIRDRDVGTTPWLMIIGALLPLLREDAFVALEQERAIGRG